MKGNKGITLIALVVTIIVLLILAGVAIAMLTGDNSILKRAQSTQAYSAIGAAKDEVNLAYNAAFAEYLKEKYEGTNTTVSDTRFDEILSAKITAADNTTNSRSTSAGSTKITKDAGLIRVVYTDNQSQKKFESHASYSATRNSESLGPWSAVNEDYNG